MTSIDDIWSSMNEESSASFAAAHNKKASAVVKKKSSKSKESKSSKEGKEEKNVTEKVKKEPQEGQLVTYEELVSRIAVDLNAINDDDVAKRRKALVSLENKLFVEYKLSNATEYSSLFRDICKTIFRRFGDSAEKCREVSQRITMKLFSKSNDLVPVLGYYFPALMQRIPTEITYDDEMKVFVSDLAAHEAYKRGRAVDRQDKSNLSTSSTTTPGVIQVIETSEEIRYITCQTLVGLLKQVDTLQAYPILHPYFMDMILFLQYQLKDPYPELKIIACEALELFARLEDYEQGMKLFSIALVRSLLPVLRHRHAKVRLAGLSALHYCMIVPDRSKRKAAGSEAIVDLVGFREENVLQVAAFYQSDLMVNHLAELVIDKSVQVRERLAIFLQALLTEIGDRYDHQSRLLPYLLDLLTDDTETVSHAALRCLTICGQQYEEEHMDDILEKRQYNIDGDHRINLEKPLPAPFIERPRIGMRLYVRGNTKRFLTALINELTNWISTTRVQSANLLKLIIVLCEEHLTMEANMIFPALIKANKFAKDDKDIPLQHALFNVFELLGRYIHPEVYVYYILPRLRGDVDVVTYGIDTELRVSILQMFKNLLDGTKVTQIVSFLDEIITTLTNPMVINFDSIKQQQAALYVIENLLSRFQLKFQSVVAAYFVTTGRITSLKGLKRKIFQYLLTCCNVLELQDTALQALTHLACMENDAELFSKEILVQRLFEQFSLSTLLHCVEQYDIDFAWQETSHEHQILKKLLLLPCVHVYYQDDQVQLFIEKVLLILLEKLKDFHRLPNVEVEFENKVIFHVSELIYHILAPLCLTNNENLYEITLPEIKKLFYPSITMNDKVYRQKLSFYPMKGRKILIDHAPLIIQDLFKNHRYNRSNDLLRRKLQFVDLLFHGQVTSITTTYDDNDDEEEVKNGLFSENIHLLKEHGWNIVEQLIIASLTPTVASDIRINAMHVVYQLLHKLMIVYDVNTMKIQSFERQQLVINEPTVLMVINKILVNLLKKGFFDGSDTVRLQAIHCINLLVPFIVRDKDEEQLLAEMEGSTSNATTTTVVTEADISEYALQENKRVTFSSAIFNIMAQYSLELQRSKVNVTEEESNTDFVASLDNLLRKICVLHPRLFKAILHSYLSDALQKGQRDWSVELDNKDEAILALIDHAELLLSLNNK